VAASTPFAPATGDVAAKGVAPASRAVPALIAERLTQRWETVPGLRGVLTTVDHKEIGRRYLLTAFMFFLIGGLEALLMRTQLAAPEQTLLSPQTYNQLFTMHGTTMVFFFATPVLSGFGNYFLPLLVGARDMAFPRLNALSYWVFLLSGVFMYSSFLLGAAPDGGWFAYVPLTSRAYSPGPNVDFWALGLIFLGISSTVGAINFIVTIFKLRAPGMSVNRLPLFAWNVAAASFMIVFALPSLTTACALLVLDRKLGTHFFDPAAGGDPLLWQHLFWIFGHPDVYIMFLPAVGIISEIIPVFTRRPIIGYSLVVLATVATAFIGFGVWLHHMFATGLPALSLAFFSAASMAIAIPSGIQVLAWTTTILTGRVVWRAPMLFAAGFLILFVMGGVTGVMVASVPFDWQVHDTYFVVAHFHYVLVGGAMMFPVFAGFHYWLPKVTGKLLDETLGEITFWLLFIGFNLTFFPMHLSGVLGMPRRIYTFQPHLGLDGFNLVSTIGAYMLGVGVLVFIWNVAHSLARGAPAGDDPWGAPSLEWATSSPPAPYNFARIPIVRGRDPLWVDRLLLQQAIRVTNPQRDTERIHEAIDERYGLRRQTPGTTLLDAVPDEMLAMPGDSYWPLVLALALAVLFLGLLTEIVAATILGVVAAAIAIGSWLWPAGVAEPESERPVHVPARVSGA
jgi:cytochrome c oxidase subunit I+III